MSLWVLIKRNFKLFFKDKGMLFTSLITPAILLVLYVTFLENVYRDSMVQSMPLGTEEALVNGIVGGELLSSLLAVCCVTVSFCSNMIMVQDKTNNSRNDLTITPVKSSTLALGYYLSTVFITFVICLIATFGGFIYLACIGWYLTFVDVLLILLDVFLLVLFGTALSSIINFFLSTHGQISAVGTIVSAGYGFICGAYMPISSFNEGLQKVISFLPGTYGTSLVRNHCLDGTFQEMANLSWPSEGIEDIKDSIDCNLYFFGNKVEVYQLYLIVILTNIALISIYILLNKFYKKKR